MPSPRQVEADLLAQDLYDVHCQLQQAGRTLHDQAGPLLSAAGIQLQLLRMDQPATAAIVDETLGMLDQVTESLRALSQTLDPSPASHIGLERALARLAEQHEIEVSYTATSRVPPAAAIAIYDAIVASLGRAGGAPARLTVRGLGDRLAVRLLWKKRERWPRAEVTALARRLRPAGVTLDVTTKQSTIVSILYATRRSARR